MAENLGKEEFANTSLSEFLFKAPCTDKVALVDGLTRREVTYKELFQLLQKLAAGLCEVGVRVGDRVAVVCVNSIEQVVSLLAILYAGAVPVPINPTYTSYELKHVMQLTKTPFCFLDAQVLDRMLEAAENSAVVLKKLILLSEDCHSERLLNDQRITTYQVLTRSSPLQQPVRRNVDATREVAMLLLSSGTTGLSKGVQLSHFNVTFMIRTLSEKFVLLPNSQQKVILTFLPLFHVYGIITCLLVPFQQRSKNIIFPRFNPDLIFPSIQQYKVHTLSVVPSVMQFMNKNAMPLQQYDLSSIDTVLYGGSMCSKEDEEEFKKIYKIKNQLQGYGSTEVSLAVLFHFPDQVGKMGSVGRVLPHTQVTIKCTKVAARLGANLVGEVCVKGPQVMLGYLNDPEATKAAFDKDGWFHTGDVGYYDKEGFFFIVDRIKDLIKFQAFQVSPTEIENLIKTHPCVDEVAVVGIQHSRFGETPKALVVRKAGCDVSKDEIIELVKANLAGYKQLRGGVEFVHKLPRNPTGKLLRNVIKQQQNQVTAPKSKM